MPRMPMQPYDHCCPPAPPRKDAGSVDVKLKILESKFIPKDLIHNFEDLEITDTTYVYIDQNGKPGKISALDLMSKEISWEDLSEEVQGKILTGVAKQDKLIQGDHIVISEDNKISVTLTAKDIGALSEDDAKSIIAGDVVLEVANIKPELKSELSLDLDNRMSVFKKDVDEQLRLNMQEVISITDNRIAARLANLGELVDTTVSEQLSGTRLDGGLVTED